MIYLRDIKKNKFWKFEIGKLAERFAESYESPENLTQSNVFYCDGSGWNGRTSGYCFGLEDELILIITPENLTNNVAEYTAILEAMRSADIYDIIISDSLLAVNQIKGLWITRNTKLRELMQQCAFIMKEKKLYLSWIERGCNLAGIKIDKQYKGLSLGYVK